MIPNKSVWSLVLAVAIVSSVSARCFAEPEAPKSSPVPAPVSAAVAKPPTAAEAQPKAAASCICAREIEYETSIQKCWTMYRYNGGEWTTNDPHGNNSCSSKQVKVKECVEWRGPGC